MKYPKKNTRRKGVSAVISSVLLASVVLTIGGGILYYARGATSVISQGYIDDTFELVYDVAERFAVEHISNNTDGTTLHIWIYNYGIVNITTDVYVTLNDTIYTSNLTNPITIDSSDYVCANITVPMQPSETLTVKVHSRRQNNAYATYVVP